MDHNASARGLVAGVEPTSFVDAFLYDQQLGSASRLSSIPAAGQTAVVASFGSIVGIPAAGQPLIAGGTFPANEYDRSEDRRTLISHLPGQPLAALGDNSLPVVMTDDARFVVFSSLAPNVLPGQSYEGLENPISLINLFVADRATGERALLRRSVSSPVIVGNEDSSVAVSGGPAGRQFLFLSGASNLALPISAGCSMATWPTSRPAATSFSATASSSATPRCGRRPSEATRPSTLAVRELYNPRILAVRASWAAVSRPWPVGEPLRARNGLP